MAKRSKAPGWASGASTSRKVAGAATATAAGAALLTGEIARRRARGKGHAEAKVPFRLPADEPAAAGLKRTAATQLQLASETLGRNGRQDLPAAIHESRKSLKRVRALVRLSRDLLGDGVYQRENRALRDAGRRLSGVRDAQVTSDSLDKLKQRYADRVPPGALDGLSAALAAEASDAHRRADRDPELIAPVIQSLETARLRVVQWPLRADDVDQDPGLDEALNGLARIYRRGRRAQRRAARDPSAERLHELRKRTKDLWYSSQLLRPMAPRQLKRMGTLAHELSDILGEDHDLAVLLTRADELSEALSPAERRLLGKLVGRRRRRLQRAALARAAKVYRHKPLKFNRQMSKATHAAH